MGFFLGWGERSHGDEKKTEMSCGLPFDEDVAVGVGE